jgi:hypothetical protein
MFCDIPVGKDTTGNFTLSYKGVAVRTDCNRFIAFSDYYPDQAGEEKTAGERKGPVRLFDVTGLTLPGCDALIYRVPVTAKNIEPGDLVLMSDCPPQVLYVTHNDPASDELTGFTAAGEKITYIAPERLGDCARFIRIESVLDLCCEKGKRLNEDEIAFVAALLCCQPCNMPGTGYGSQLISSTVVESMPALAKSGKLNKLPLLLALQQSRCLESYILTRAFQNQRIR